MEEVYFWYYSEKRHAIGVIDNEYEAQRFAHARVPGLIVFAATNREMEDH